MDRLLGFASSASRWMVWCAGVIFLLAAFLITLEVVLRQVFSVSLGGVDEVSGYALAVGSAWGFSYALIERAHIRIDSLYQRLPLRLRGVLDIVGLLALLGFISVMARYAWDVFELTLRFDSKAMTPMATPLWIPQSMWVFGLFCFVLVALLLLIRALASLIRGDFAAIGRLAGTRTAVEELEEELEDVMARR